MKSVSAAFTTAVKSPSKTFLPKVLIDWNQATVSNPSQSAPFFDRYVFTDETAHLNGYSISRKTSSHPWGVIQGTATVKLNNATGRYFPNHDATIGDYVALPNRPVRLQVGVGSEYINLFSGYLGRPRVSVTGGYWEATAVDALAYISGKISNMGGKVGYRADQLISLLLQEAGLSTSQFVLDPSVQPIIQYCSPNNKKIIDVINALCEAEQYLLFVDGDGVIRGHNTYHTAAITADAWDFSFDNTTDMDYRTSSIINDVIVEARPYQIVPYSKIYSLTQASDNTLVPANGSVTIWASLSDDDNNEIYGIDVDSPIYGGEYISNFLTNTQQDGSGMDNHAAISLSSMTVMGSTIKAVFSNSSAIATYITRLEFYGTSAQKEYYQSKEAIDRTSISLYGVNPDESTPGEANVIQSEYIQSAEAAAQYAVRLVETYANPRSQLNIDTFIVPQLEVGDRVGVTVDGSKQEFVVFGEEFSAENGARFRQKLYLDENEQLNYFVLDSDALDGSRVLAP